MFFFLFQKFRERLNQTGPKIYEATDEEDKEEFTLVASTFTPQHNQRAPRGTALISKRVPLTAANKKKVNKASIGLPIFRTFKLATENCFPFILENCVSLEATQIHLGEIINNRDDSGLNTVSETRRAHFTLTSAFLQRISLGGTTLYSVAEQVAFTLPQELVQGPSEDCQDQPAPDNANLQISVPSHLDDLETELTVKVYTWLEDIRTPRSTELEIPNLATQLEYADFVSNIDLDEDVWDLIERDCRQRKSRFRQGPITMSIENTSVRGSNNTRPSASYSRSVESQTRATASAIKDHPGTSARRPKSMPSGSQLPSGWNDDMDKFICHMEAQGGFSIKSIGKALKQRFAELRDSVVPEDAIQRRIDTLDSQDNPYFVKGAEMAIVQAEANGYEIPPFDPVKYPIMNWEVKPDHLVLGTSPGKEVIDSGYEYSLQPRVAGGIDINTIKIGPDTPKKTLPIRIRQEATHRVQNAGTYLNTKGLKVLTEMTNDIGARSSGEVKHSSGSDGGLADITNTMSRARVAANPPNDSAKDDVFGGQVYITPRKSSKKAASDTNHETIRAMNNGSPTPTRGLYRSGRENAISSSTTGTSILGFGREGFGRENTGGPTLLERRRARQEGRDLSMTNGAGELPRTP